MFRCDTFQLHPILSWNSLRLTTASRWPTLPYIIYNGAQEPWQCNFSQLTESEENATNPAVHKAVIKLWTDDWFQFLAERLESTPTRAQRERIEVVVTSSSIEHGITVEELLKGLLSSFEMVQDRFRQGAGTPHAKEFVREFLGFDREYIDTDGCLHLLGSRWKTHNDDFREW